MNISARVVDCCISCCAWIQIDTIVFLSSAEGTGLNTQQTNKTAAKPLTQITLMTHMLRFLDYTVNRVTLTRCFLSSLEGCVEYMISVSQQLFSHLHLRQMTHCLYNKLWPISVDASLVSEVDRRHKWCVNATFKEYFNVLGNAVIFLADSFMKRERNSLFIKSLNFLSCWVGRSAFNFVKHCLCKNCNEFGRSCKFCITSGHLRCMSRRWMAGLNWRAVPLWLDHQKWWRLL